jgi:hypothetical protein
MLLINLNLPMVSEGVVWRLFPGDYGGCLGIAEIEKRSRQLPRFSPRSNQVQSMDVCRNLPGADDKHRPNAILWMRRQGDSRSCWEIDS